VPSVLIAMLDLGHLERHGLPSVRTLFFAGEVFPTPQLRRLRRALPAARLYNLFGPMETNLRADWSATTVTRRILRAVCSV